MFSGHVNTQPGSKAWGEKGGSILLSPPAIAWQHQGSRTQQQGTTASHHSHSKTNHRKSKTKTPYTQPCSLIDCLSYATISGGQEAGSAWSAAESSKGGLYKTSNFRWLYKWFTLIQNWNVQIIHFSVLYRHSHHNLDDTSHYWQIIHMLITNHLFLEVGPTSIKIKKKNTKKNKWNNIKQDKTNARSKMKQSKCKKQNETKQNKTKFKTKWNKNTAKQNKTTNHWERPTVLLPVDCMFALQFMYASFNLPLETIYTY